jgi:hypothetical protein
MRAPNSVAYGAELLLAVSCLALWLVAAALQWPWWAQMLPFVVGVGMSMALVFSTGSTLERHDSPGYRGLT